MSIYVPSKAAPSYGGYEGVIDAVDGSTLRVYKGADFQPFSYPPTPGGTIVAANWYGPGGPKNPLARTWLSVYDPVALANRRHRADRTASWIPPTRLSWLSI